MNNFISIVEIPTSDFARAVVFYKAILSISIEEIDMDGIAMGLFPGNEGSVSVALIHGLNYTPASNGAVVYLNAGDDLQPVLDKVAANGGAILIPKSDMGSGMGFYAMFLDSEGNRLGLYSKA